MKYLVVWEGILKNDQGDAPVSAKAYDTTIEANAYKDGMINGIVMFTKDEKKETLREELNSKFYIQNIDSNENIDKVSYKRKKK